ncbi:hypothetical protein G6T08_005070 [Salmonella enterica]|uniref:hypothetical protein n=1 Tax=Salmonella enterica TaxID=28901 RepID=UPI000B9FC92E|nr:hypothetical protein [Salmonella enterica]EBV4143978.1 hypothetical protein [Salmonella enterica subsp. enterica serovar Benin]EBC1279781.1 hypothetical protein [Salmonella enterica]EBE6989647.1 hypothetical protein [Salmonella enterica]EBE7299776.1 hypothetical protein [Salmonella enterica]EBW4219256.1 hypothetical protein [Salmonella enterica subsp. enterica serovar Benin]
MKVYNTSLIKKGILFSLFLLSPEILAAENLNFKYTRADASSLDPRLSKLAKACHTLTDPLNINVQFGGMLTNNVNVKMRVYGSNASKGYAVYTLPGSPGKSASGSVNRAALKSSTTDPDLLVPFGLSIKGQANLQVAQSVSRPVLVTEYGDPFCFSKGVYRDQYKFPASDGAPPIYYRPPYTKWLSDNSSDFETYCVNSGKERPSNQEDTYWPHYGEDIPGPVANGIEKGGWDGYLGKYIFYRGKKQVDSGKTETTSKWVNLNPTVDKAITALSTEYDFPIYKYDTSYSALQSGNFNLQLFNRDVTRLELEITVFDGDPPSINLFTWKRDNSYPNNVLAYQGATLQIAQEPGGDIENDPYQTFYKNISQSYFRGTLVDDSSLNQKYKDQINNIMPLSLPAKRPGDINLVNTDSLTFKIKMTSGIYGGNFQVTVYGQPLKFGPLYTGSKMALSAMQVRDACY